MQQQNWTDQQQNGLRKIKNYQMQMEGELMHGITKRMEIQLREVLSQNLKQNLSQKK